MEQTPDKLIAEGVAESYAAIFLNTYIGNDIFLGGDIEQVLADDAFVIYRVVKDPEYYGAAIHKNGRHFIVINTDQPLRTRYYSAAHELWHLLVDNGMLERDDPQDAKIIKSCDFDHEQAADHFAAAVMLPKKLIVDAWHKLNSQVRDADAFERAILRIADLSSMPYQSVVRRLSELEILNDGRFANRSEREWIKRRDQLGISPSPLDLPVRFSKFQKFSDEVAHQVDRKQITLEEASRFLRFADPKQAADYWTEHVQHQNNNLAGD